MDFKKLRTILILRQDGGLGDEVIFSMLYRELKKANPRLKIYVFALGTSADFLKKNKYIDVLYTAKFRHLRYNQRWLTMIFLGIKLAMNKYDAVLDMNNFPQKNWSLFRAIASRFKYSAINYKSHGSHFSDRVIALIESCGIKNTDTSYDIPVLKESLEKVSSFSSSKPYIVLNPFGRKEDRTFTDETLNLLTDSIRKFETKNIIIPYMKILPNIKQNKALLFHTETIWDLIALIYQSDMVITPDTAAVHIATGFKKKTIAFYNKPDDLTWQPNNHSAIVIKTNMASVNDFNTKEFEDAYTALSAINA